MVIMPASAASASAPALPAAVPNMPLKNERLNGYPDDGGGVDSGAASAWPSNTRNDLQCCLLDNGRRCTRIAGNASYNKRIQKTVAQKKLKLQLDNSVSNKYNSVSQEYSNTNMSNLWNVCFVYFCFIDKFLNSISIITGWPYLHL